MSTWWNVYLKCIIVNIHETSIAFAPVSQYKSEQQGPYGENEFKVDVSKENK